MKIAIISDTHDLLRHEVIQQIQMSDAVVHAGDFSSQKVIDSIKKEMKKPEAFYGVRGNNDKDWAEGMPESLKFEIAGVPFFVVHNKKHLPEDLGKAQLVIFGHSHKYSQEEKDGRLYLNPGSCGKRRFHQEISMAVVHIFDGKWTVEKIVIEHGEQINVKVKTDGRETAAGEKFAVFCGYAKADSDDFEKDGSGAAGDSNC